MSRGRIVLLGLIWCISGIMVWAVARDAPDPLPTPTAILYLIALAALLAVLTHTSWDTWRRSKSAGAQEQSPDDDAQFVDGEADERLLTWPWMVGWLVLMLAIDQWIDTRGHSLTSKGSALALPIIWLLAILYRAYGKRAVLDTKIGTGELT